MVRVDPAICPGIGVRGTGEEKVDTALGKERQQIQGVTMCYPFIEKSG